MWESIRLYHYHSNYEDTMKRLRILGLIFSLINIVIKIAIVIIYFKLSKEKQDDGFLGINNDLSVNEVDENDYLAKNQFTPLKQENILN